MKIFIRSLGAVLFCGLLGCVSFLYPRRADESTESEPPRSWSSAVTFQFSDASVHPFASHRTRIEFHDGVRPRVVTVDDLMNVREYDERTPWYRLRRSSITVRVTIEHPGGYQTVAEYPLSVERDEFYYLSALVYTRGPEPMGRPPHSHPPVSFPLHPMAQAQPGDSLWIGYNQRGRYCFDCPT